MKISIRTCDTFGRAVRGRAQDYPKFVRYLTPVGRSKSANAFIVALNGHLDIYRIPEVRKALESAAAHRRLIIDMRAVASVSAAILTEFVRCHKRRSADGLEPARLVVNSAAVRKIFEITDLTRLLPLFDTLDAAHATT